MKNFISKWSIAALLTLAAFTGVMAQNSHAVNTQAQSVVTALSTLPEADLLIYLNPQKILNEAAPKVMSAAEVDEMKAAFFDIKRSAGIDPATVEYLVIAVRFRKPTAELSFVPPDVVTIFGGDFSAESLMTLGKMAFGEKMRDETYGSRVIGVAKVDELGAMDIAKNPMLKNWNEVGAVNLTPTSIAIGNISYLKAAIDAVDGNGRINPATVQSLLRDSNSLIAASGSPLSSFAKSFGLQGTEAAARDPRCDTHFGDFYAGVTLVGNNLSIRGALNADNPDTAKIIHGLIDGLKGSAMGMIPDQQAQTTLQGIKMTARENEIVFEGEVPAKTVADYFKSKPAAKQQQQTKPRPVVRKRRPAKKQ